MTGSRPRIFSRAGLPPRWWMVMGLLLLSACGTTKPILAPNAHFRSQGAEVAQREVEECRQMADAAGASEGTGKAGKVAGQTAVGAGVGAASGAVGGAVIGAAGSGSMIGAASGAVVGLLTGLWHAMVGPSEPNQTYKNFVDVCLKERGYEIAGWQ